MMLVLGPLRILGPLPELPTLDVFTTTPMQQVKGKVECVAELKQLRSY